MDFKSTIKNKISIGSLVILSAVKHERTESEIPTEI